MLVLCCLAIRAAARLRGVAGISALVAARFALVAAATAFDAGRAGVRTAFNATVGGALRLLADVLARALATGAAVFFARLVSVAVSSACSRRTSRGSTSSRSPRKTGCRITPSRVHSANLTSATNFGFTQVGFSLARGGGPLKGDALMISGFISL